MDPTPPASSMHRAKHPRSVAAGLYGHPVHPILVTIPIGAWTSSLVFDLAAMLGDRPAAFATGSNWLIGIGIIGALVAATFGAIDLSTIERGTRAFTTGLTHAAINVVVTLLYVVNFFLRRSQGYDDVSAGALVLSIVALAMLGVSGWLGGKLSYRYGVRVADEGTQAEGFVGSARSTR
ncbi:MAG TPA: DUF2231 domain-containing protein [Ornithinibacter sp.]|nr:DUF2231 domain-containing protein [Ornithinibacter sp.]